MDVKEFLDSLSMMCKEGIKTKEFRESYMGKKMAQGHPKYETFDFDFYDIWYNYTKGDVNKYFRRELISPRLKGSKYQSIEFKRWTPIVKYALGCYFRANNEMFSNSASKRKKSEIGWYVLLADSTKKDELFKELDNFKIGYNGGLDNSYDFNFGKQTLYWNLNHQEPWNGLLGGNSSRFFNFKPSFNLSPVFMNWYETPWEVKE